jgi:hypothetical protein
MLSVKRGKYMESSLRFAGFLRFCEPIGHYRYML